MSNSYISTEPLLRTIMENPKRDIKQILNKVSATSWNSSGASSPNMENTTKYRERLMKPLQTHQKKELLVLSSNKHVTKVTQDQFSDWGYHELLTKVGELNKISKLHDKYIGAKSHRIEDSQEEDDLLKANLSERVFAYVKRARENSVGQVSQASNASIILQNSMEASRNNSLERENQYDEKQKKLASQLSSSRDKKVPKQLNSNAHFRHTARKVLMLRAIGSASKHKDIIKGFFADVDACKKVKEPNSMVEKEPSVKTNVSPLISSRRLTDERLTTEPTISKFPTEDTYFVPPSQIHQPLAKEKVVRIEASPIKSRHLLNFSEPYNNSIEIVSSRTNEASRKKSPTNESNCQGQNDKEHLDRSQETEKSPIRIRLIGNDLKLNRVATLDSLREIPKEQCNPLKSKRSLGCNDNESYRGSKSPMSASKIPKFKQKVLAEHMEQKGNRFKAELKLNLKSSVIGPDDFMSLKSIKSLKSISSLRVLKHTRGNNSVSLGSTDPVKNRKAASKGISIKTRPRGENDSPLSGTQKTIQELIENSYQGTLTDRDLGRSDVEVILNSYGFEDTIGQIKHTKNKSRFSTLDGYQREFFKESIARTDRYIEKKKRDKNDGIL